jgi:hypothetical protein
MPFPIAPPPPSSASPAQARGKQRIVRVDRAQYCKLLISRKKMVRQDDYRQDARGLFDTETGVLYLIQESEL